MIEFIEVVHCITTMKGDVFGTCAVLVVYFLLHFKGRLKCQG